MVLVPCLLLQTDMGYHSLDPHTECRVIFIRWGKWLGDSFYPNIIPGCCENGYFFLGSSSWADLFKLNFCY